MWSRKKGCMDMPAVAYTFNFLKTGTKQFLGLDGGNQLNKSSSFHFSHHFSFPPHFVNSLTLP